VSKIQAINLLGAGLWIAIPWSFFLGFGNAWLVILLIFAFAAAIAKENSVSQKPSVTNTLVTMATLGLGIAIYDPLNKLGGIYHIANTLFSASYVLPLVSTLAFVRIFNLQSIETTEPNNA